MGRRIVGYTGVGADRIIAQDAEFYDDPTFPFYEVELRNFDAALGPLRGIMQSSHC